MHDRAHDPDASPSKGRTAYGDTSSSHFVFLHIPKTSGTSLANALSKEMSVCFDYGKGNEKNSPSSRSEIGTAFKTTPGVMYFGHFSASYLGGPQPGAVYFSWVREPVNRVISSFLHERRSLKLSTDLDMPDVRDALLRFVCDPKQQNVMSQYLGSKWRDFDFIGVSEYWNTSHRRFGEQLIKHGLTTRPLDVHADNSNPHRNEMFYSVPEYVISTISNSNVRDIMLYRAIINEFIAAHL